MHRTRTKPRGKMSHTEMIQERKLYYIQTKTNLIFHGPANFLFFSITIIMCVYKFSIREGCDSRNNTTITVHFHFFFLKTT